MLTGITANTKTNLSLGMFVLSTGYTFGSGPTGILGASTGGGSFSAVPIISTPEINGLHKNTKGFIRIDGWEEVSAKCTNVELTEEGILLALTYGSAATANSITTITPAQGLVPDSEYADLWISGELSSGKLFAIKLTNALNNNGFNISFEDKNNGKYDLDIRANYDVTTLSTPPFTIYLDNSVAVADAIELSSIAPADGSTGAAAAVVLTFNNAIASHGITVMLASTGEIIPGTSTYDATHKVVTFTPTSAFASALHIVSVAGVTDIYGQTLATVTKTFTVSQ